ncbi:AMP-binding protein [Alcaligenes phenolicus]|uniref:Long-chain fatty acid--CoA ligase n=1 Tax=Alcaligenes phenolicus TaxID=232846 RepID=A0AAW5VS72_9BURK|nr:AMP-binding protein [Alcaligenes phenolicus]MCX5564290.1 long-chain fatty acid--CoA ligase [Alcaligenes phenolicus]
MDETRHHDTFPSLLLRNSRIWGDKFAYRHKDYGIWQTWTWAEIAQEVRWLACGLASLGFRRGMTLSIVGHNHPRFYGAMTAAQALGGIPVPLYQDAPIADIAHAIKDAEVDFAIAEDQEQTDKLLDIRRQTGLLRTVVYEDPKGLKDYRDDGLYAYDHLLELGRAYDRDHPAFFESEVDAGAGDDVSVMLYTSGTTGRPKGVCLTHHAMLSAGRGGVGFDSLTHKDEVMSYLPMAWAGDHYFSYAQAMVGGFTVNCPESPDTVMLDLREIAPTYYFAPPRIFESMLTTVQIRMEDASWPKRKIFEYFMEIARKVGTNIIDRRPVPLSDRLKYWLGGIFVFNPLKDVLGLSRIRVAYTAGAAIGPDLFRFYRSIGINLKQFYGSTETCAYVCIQPDGQVRLDSVGVPAPGVEVKISDDGEVLVKSAAMLKEYYKSPEATAEVINTDGYFRTGDAGLINQDGQLQIIDRVSDLGRTQSASLFAPNYLENKLKFFSYIKEAVTFGNELDQVYAFINIDLEAVGNWAERRNLPYSGYTDLAGKPAVYELIASCIEQVNRDLANESSMAGAQIGRFLILHKELDPDDGELTRTRKVRRRFIAEKYRILLDALIDGKDKQYVETEVVFEDGRAGSVAATVTLSDAKTFPATQEGA